MKASNFQTAVFVGLLLAFGVVSRISLVHAEEADAAKDAAPVDKAAAVEAEVTQGALRIVHEDGTVVECPLRHTDVEADISGFIARVKVTQTFVNPTKEKIEAVYVFPLPHEAAVDEMTMVIGERRIVGVIKRRDDARQIYEQALLAGQTAALLEQERPNIFTQSVGNIEPGQEINIEISYVDVLKYDLGTYEFHFPMVVGPRYNPGGSIAAADGATINPPVLEPGERNGHDIGLTVNLDAGVPIQNLSNANHKVHTVTTGDRQARVRLLQEDSLPNKDFVLRYDVVGEKPALAMLAHTGNYSCDARQLGEGYFMLMIQPQEDERLKQSPPREVVFLVDVSGSMSGEPTAKVIDAMQNMLKLCRDIDTVQVITFASQANKLFDKAVPVTEANIKRALDFTSGLSGSGGTEMLQGIKLAIDEPVDKERVRIVVMLTDGYIGNEAEIIEHVGKNSGDQVRFWAIGIGASPNMFLIDGVAKQGQGMGKKLGLQDDTVALTQEVMTRIQRAQLANVKIDWGKFQVAETHPVKLPELWAGRPVIVFGRYAGGGDGKITVSGTVEGENVSWPLAVSLPEKQEQHDVLAKVWARKKIEDLMHQTFYLWSPAVEEEVTAIALNYRLMSQYTSFVAVDAKASEEMTEPARPPRRMTVPVPLPQGSDWTGFFGEQPRLAGEDFAFRGKVVTTSLVLLSDSVREDAGRIAGNGRFAAPAPRYALGLGDVALKKSVGREQGFYDGFSSYWMRTPVQAPNGGTVLIAGFRAEFKTADRWITPTQLFSGVEQLHEFDFSGREGASLATQSAAMVESARKTYESAEERLNGGDLSAARNSLLDAYLLDTAATNYGQSDGQIAADALAKLEEIHTRQVVQWTAQEPLLNARLDLVVRDQSVNDALTRAAQAAGLKLEIVPGSIDDAAASIGREGVRVNYLDLRRATAAQAFDWILHPVKLTWSLADGRIVVRSDRRGDVPAAWTYDVSSIALPTTDELGDLKDQQKVLDASKDATEQFLRVVRGELKPADDQDIRWIAPGRLLIFGDAKLHAAAEALFGKLAGPQFDSSDAVFKLRVVTHRRAVQRKDELAKQVAARHQLSIAKAHDEFGWRLLAAAAAAQVDDEALTELEIAWRDEATAKLLSGDAAPLILRSLWMVCESSRALPEDNRLAKLAQSAQASSREAADRAVATLKEKSDDAAAFASVLYAALALRDDAQFLEAARPLLAAPRSADSPLAAASTVARVLLTEPTDSDREQLRKLLADAIAGDELTVLVALACRRAGDDTWTAFRAAAHESLAQQPLRGEVIVLLSHLSAQRLALSAR